MTQTRCLEGGGSFQELRKGILGVFEAVGGNRKQGFHVAECAEPGLDHMPMQPPPALGRQRGLDGVHQRQHQRDQEGVAAGFDEAHDGGELRQGDGRRQRMGGQLGRKRAQRRRLEGFAFDAAE